MKFQNADKLMEKGRASLLAGDFHAAAKAFARVLRHYESVVVRNNLAFATFMAGDPRGALKILEPLLSAEKGENRANPYTFALASRICSSLGDEERARHWLQEAVRSFDDEVKAIYRSKKSDIEDVEAFLEYTFNIMDAASALKDHRLVYDLYRRWEHLHVTWINCHLAAVACFNMRRYKQAASLWSSIADIQELFSTMAQVAFLIERGVLPPFEMDYTLYSTEELEEMFQEAAKNEDGRYRCAQNGFIRITMLGRILEEKESKGAYHTLYNLVYYGGEWGEQLGRSVLDRSIFPTQMKMAAAEALIDRGILKEGEPVPMVIDGRQQMVRLEFKKIKIIEGSDEKLDEVVQSAIKLRDKGKVEEATGILEDLYRREIFYPPAMLTLANLLRRQKKLDEALEILKALEEMAPEEPVILFNLAGLMLQMEDPERARSYFDRIDPAKATDEIRSKLGWLEREIEKAEAENGLFFPFSPEELMRSFMEDQRQDVEEKPLPVDAPLARGLKNMPANWLTGGCRAHGLDPSRHRQEREKQLAEFLTNRENLTKAVESLSRKQRNLLTYLLEQGGWSRLSAVTRKFGSMSGDGFYWEEKEPQSALGVLWSRALVMVGRAKLSGRNCKIATIPLELREPLKEILSKGND